MALVFNSHHNQGYSEEDIHAQEQTNSDSEQRWTAIYGEMVAGKGVYREY